MGIVSALRVYSESSPCHVLTNRIYLVRLTAPRRSHYLRLTWIEILYRRRPCGRTLKRPSDSYVPAYPRSVDSSPGPGRVGHLAILTPACLDKRSQARSQEINWRNGIRFTAGEGIYVMVVLISVLRRTLRWSGWIRALRSRSLHRAVYRVIKRRSYPPHHVRRTGLGR